MYISFNLKLYPDKIRELRDIYGMSTESAVYQNFFEIAVTKIVEALIKDGYDYEAIRHALNSYKPNSGKILEMASPPPTSS